MNQRASRLACFRVEAARFAIPVLGASLTICGTALAAHPGQDQPHVGLAANGPVSDDDFARLIKQLDSPDLSARESATATLGSEHRISLARIEAEMGSASLSPEQRERLDIASWLRFQSGPRGALGVSFDQSQGRASDGVPIMATIEGFEANEVLRSGDVIHAMDGVRVFDFPDSRRMILSHNPGETITLQVLRKGEPLLLKCKLGNFADLNSPDVNLNNPRRMRNAGAVAARIQDPQLLKESWRERRTRILNSARITPSTLDPGVSPGYLGSLTVDAETKVQARADSAASSGAASDSDEDLPALRPGGMVRTVDITALEGFGGQARLNASGGSPLARIRADINAVGERMKMFDAKRKEANLPIEQRRQYEQLYLQSQMMLRDLQVKQKELARAGEP